MVGIAHRTYSTTFANDTPRIALATFSAMKARRTGLVVEWVVEEDARRILLSSPSGAGRVGATARGRALGTELAPPLAPSQGCEQETTVAGDAEATAQGRALGTELAPPLALSQGREQETPMTRYEGMSRTNHLGAF